MTSGPSTPSPPAPHTYRYGDLPAQVCDLYLPTEPVGTTRRGVVVLVHGGFWRARYDRSLQEPVARDLSSRGWAVWNVDYRGVGPGERGGGGWPTTYQDVAAALDLLAVAAGDVGLELPKAGEPGAPLVVVGHSAGGALALWSAGRGAGAVVRPTAVVAQGAVCDLVAAARKGIGNGAVLDLMGGPPQDRPGDYADADPSSRLPLGVPVLLVTGDADEAVPHRQSVDFARRAQRAGDRVRLEILPGEGHFGHLDPGSGVYRVTRDWLEGLVSS